MDFPSSLAVGRSDLLLAGWIIAALLIGIVRGSSVTRHVSSLSAVILLLAALLSLLQMEQPPATAFAGVYLVTPLIALAKAVTFALIGLTLFIGRNEIRDIGLDRYEFPVLMVCAGLGAGIMLSANSLISLFMGVETLGLSSYILASFDRDGRRSAEAGLKYFVLGSLASGIFLYGASLVYGYSGALDFPAIAAAPVSLGLRFGMVLMLAGLAFKAAAAPFHIWTPDVYQGAPTPVATLFATGSKFAAVVILTRVMFELFGAMADSWTSLIAVLSALSLLVGTLGALFQTSLRRIIAYSSIANVGFALMSVAAGPERGAGPLLLFMMIYSVGVLGLFACLMVLRLREAVAGDISDLAGLAQRRPALAVCMAFFIFSLAGIPPLAGFFGKWAVLSAALDAGLVWLVIVGILASVAALGYYLRLVWAMFMDESKTSGDKEHVERSGFVTILALAVLLFPILVVQMGPFSRLADRAADGRGIFR